MSIFKAVICTAISFALLGSLIPALADAQTPSAKPARSTTTETPKPIKRREGKQLEDLEQEIRELKKQQEDLKSEVRELKQGEEEIRKRMLELKEILLARQPPGRPQPPEKISIASRPSRGSETARVVVVEFSDYQCPFCALFFRQTLPQLDQDYIRTGKVKYVFNNVPLDQIHPAAFKAAAAAECAGDQGKFWEMHDRIFANQRTLSPADLTAHAKAIGLELNQFSQCLEGDKSTAAIKAGLALAEKVGVDGTPTFVIALTDPQNPQDTNVRVLSIISGAQPFAVFKSALDKALALK